MKPLPKAPFAGKLFRIKTDTGFRGVLETIERHTGRRVDVMPIAESKWLSFWIISKVPLAGGGEVPENDGSFAYPFLLRESDDRYMLVSREANLVDKILEQGGVGGHIDSPRVQVDRAVRELVFPSSGNDSATPGRKYTIGAVFAAAEGYARALRSLSFFGDDLAETELFRYALKQIIATRIGLRDPSIDKELMSISSAGAVDFNFRGAQHLNSIDGLTSYFRGKGYIEWRQGRAWAADLNPLP